MIFDTVSIIGSIMALGVMLLSWIFNPFRRKIYDTAALVPSKTPPLSLVIIVQNYVQTLETNILLWLSQEYSADLQTIVVFKEEDKFTNEVLKRLGQTKKIHTTFIPNTSRYISKNKLAITLGVKASCYQLIMLVNADCRPASNKCLSLLAQYYNPSTDSIILPFSKYEEPSSGFYQFKHLHQSLYYMYKAINSRAYACNSNCLLFSKNMFLKGQGFLGNLHLAWGEYEFLINRYSSKKATTVVVDPNAQIIQQSPTRQLWLSNAVEEHETLSHLDRSVSFKMLYTMDKLLLLFSYIIYLSIAILGIIHKHWILFGINAIMFCSFILLRILLAKRILNLLKVNIKTWLIPLYELHIIWHDLMVKFRHKLTNKIKFSSHKL